jgi:signal transduction histidine kinase
VLVALIAVGVAALVSVRLVSVTAKEVSRSVLAQQADVVAALADERALGLRRVVDVLRGQEITIVLISGRGQEVSDDPVATAAARGAGAEDVLDGRSVSREVAVDGRAALVEARGARSGGFALVKQVDTPTVIGPVMRRNLLFALLAGVGAALLAGVVVARLLARPLRGTAAAAHVLRSGRRDVRVPERGPSEIAEVAGAVNDLADALARSEARQRAILLSVSHELRTPLTAVSGFAESLADGVVTGTDVPHVGRTVLREAHRLQRLVDDLMELARLEADDFRLDLGPVDLDVLTREAAEVWAQRCASAGVVFRREAPEAPVVALGDPRRLRQVLDGLAENALRVTPAGAPLVISAAVAPGGAAVLEVRDGGPGLSEEDMAVAFTHGVLHERYRDHRPVGVGGIGLALVQGLVVRMGGTMAVSRAAEGGACFRAVLPPAR